MSIRTKTVVFSGALGLAAAALAAGASGASTDPLGYGKYEFQAKCASCHGDSGKGNGPMAASLVRVPPDLTTLSTRYGGSFPTHLAWQIIDGRPYEGDAQAPRQMPVWGQEFRHETTMSPEPPDAPELHVDTRIAALVDYLESIQAR
jgi:mono/diheme cytochrome c family protein